MAASLLRTYNAANEILDRKEERANALAPPPCMMAANDYPKASPLGKKVNATMAAHLFDQAEVSGGRRALQTCMMRNRGRRFC